MADSVNMEATGRFVYIDDNGNTVGVKHAKVRLWDTDWFVPCPVLGACREFMGEGETDDNGYFTVSGSGTDDVCGIINLFTGTCVLWIRDNPDPYVEVEADSAAGVVQTAGISNYTYCFKSGFRDNANGNTDFGTISPDSPGTYTAQGGGQGCGTGQDVTGQNGAWQLFNNVRESWEFVRGYSLITPGRDIPKVRVIWPDILGSSLYRPPIPLLDEGAISIQGGQEFNEAVIMHEYGHHVMQHFAENPLPDYNNGHCDPVQILWFGGHCAWESEKNSVHWTEGWPDFLSEVLTTHYGKNDTFTSNACPDFNTGSPCTLENPPHNPIPDTNYRFIEGYTAAILWDQLDPANSSEDQDGNGSRDNLSQDFGVQWDVLINYDPDQANPWHNHPVTIDEFWTGYAVRYPYLANRLSEIYHENHITDKQAADLRVTALGNPPASAVTGGTFPITETTHNFGTVNTGETFQTNIYLSSDALISTSDIYVDGRYLTLSAVTNSSASYTVTVPVNMAPGTYYLGACADAEGIIFESNETNNCFASGQVTVQLPTIAVPDYIVTGIITNPAIPAPGQNVNVTVSVKNQGNQTALNSLIVGFYKNGGTVCEQECVPGFPGPICRIYCDRPKPPYGADFTCTLSGLVKGATTTCTGTVSYASAGTYNMRAIVDRDNSVMERDENNNTFGPQAISVVQPCVMTTFFRDADGDGYGSPSVTTQACAAPAGYVGNNSDCNDNDSTINPAAAEACDLRDNNCNGQIDEGVKITFYRDADGDNYGNAINAIQACSQLFGYVANSADCNDNVSSIHPGATEICNSVDDNCNGQADEGGVCYPPVRTFGASITYYPSLLEAISAVQGSAAVIQTKIGDVLGEINFNRPISFTLHGGFDDTYSGANGYTTLYGPLTVSRGSLAVNRLIIK